MRRDRQTRSPSGKGRGGNERCPRQPFAAANARQNPGWAPQFLGAASLLLIGLLATASSGSFAAGILHADSESDRWNLAPHADYLEETGAELSVEALRQPSIAGAFKPLGADTVNLGIRESAFWFRVVIANPRQHRSSCYVEIDNARIKRVDFHAPGAAAPEAHQWSGTTIPFNARSMPYRHSVFRLTLEPGQQQTVYLRAFHRGSYRFNLTLWEVEAFVYQHTLHSGVYGMFYGSLLIMFAFNLILSVLFRHRTYFLLSVIIATAGLYMLAYQRIDSQYFWPDTANVPGSRLNLFVGLGLCAIFLFSRDFLATARNAPRWDKVYLVYALLSLLVCSDIVVEGIWTDWLLHFVGATAPVILVVGAVISIRQGHRYAWGYLVAWGLVFCTMIPFALLGAGIIPQTFLVEHGVRIAFPITLALNSIALWQRFRELQAEHRDNLDRQVKERTKELTEALDNVKTLHGLIPICSACKSVRDDQGFWTRVETYIHAHSDADFTHGICPDCAKKLYNFSAKG